FLLAGPVDGAAGARGPRWDAAEAAATGTPAVAAGPAGNGVPALPGPSAAALMPGPHAQTQASTPVGSWPISAVAPAVGPDGLPRRVPGASQPSVESYGQPATPGTDNGALGTQSGAGVGSGAASAAEYGTGPFAPAAFHGADGVAWPGVSTPADGQGAPSGAQAPDGSPLSPHYSQSSHSSHSSLQVSGLDAIALPVPPDAPGARYSLGPLAPVPVDGGLGRRRAGGDDERTLPHQPVPEPRRESERLPSRLSPVRPQTPAAPAPEASPLVPPQPPAQPEPPRAGPPAPPAPAPQSATAPQPSDHALPRRVRKPPPAQPEWPTAPMSAVTGPVPPQDPAAVRDALLEYEAGVERALHDSADDMPTRRLPARHAGPSTPERDGEDQ
ncbi:MAG: hypothetical protein JF587_25105, partial [Catenulisporales bacterium]|nr:hypothetical protein [Catenulisporales bacterium]